MVTKISGFQPKQDLKTVPFQYLHEKVTLAGRKAVESLVKNEEEAYERFIIRKEKEWSDTHEAPNEGSLREMFPYTPPSNIKEERAKAEQEALKDIIKVLKLKEKAMWILPQVTAYIAKMKLTRTADGKIDPLAFLRDNFVTDWDKGLYRYCTCFQRGLIVPGQYTETYKNYSALVPLLMMPFKKFDGIKYDEWPTSEQMQHVLDPQLYLAMIVEPVDPWLIKDRNEILEWRDKGLIYGSGEKKGQSRNPISSFKLYGDCDDEAFYMPWLCQVMASQIWMAHPSIRTNVMVLNPQYWDDMPTPLIDQEVVKWVKPKDIPGRVVIHNDLDWLA